MFVPWETLRPCSFPTFPMRGLRWLTLSTSAIGHGFILMMTSFMQCAKIENVEVIRNIVRLHFRVLPLQSVKSLRFSPSFRFLKKDIALLSRAVTSVVSRVLVLMVERVLSYATTPNKKSTAPAPRNILVNYVRSEEPHLARNKHKDTRGRCLVSINCLTQ